MSVLNETKRLTTRNLLAMKGKERIAMLTAYDVVTASLLDQAGVEILLVGDSVGNVVYGFDTTLPVTMDMILAHSGAVVRGSKRAFVIADLPFMSYQVSVEEALKNAGRCLAEVGAHAVKLEGASPHILQTVQRLVQTGIPVMGHIGLTPQSVHQMGGYFMHGKAESDADRIFAEAKALSEAGCFALVLECVEKNLAQKISQAIPALTIGIGSGDVCDGEVLVINDILNYGIKGTPKFATQYCDLKEPVLAAAQKYVAHTKGQA